MQFKLPLIGILAALALPAQATEFIATNTYAIGKEQVVDEEQWVLAGIVETEGTFENDLFIASGNELQLNGTYQGNVWGAASMGANLRGSARRNVRLTGKTVRIEGTIGGNLMALADTIQIATNATIEGNVRLLGTSIVMEGHIGGNADITAARIATLGGTMKGNVEIISQDILLARDARIGGDLIYTTNKELIPAEGVVAGQLKRVVPEAPPAFSSARLVSRSLWFLAAFLAGVPFIALFPMSTAMASQLVRRSPWKCLLVGFLASGALPVFGIMCVSSIIGVPLGVLVITAWGVMVYLSRIIMGLVLGTLILRTVGSSIGRVLLAMALGLAIIYLSTLVPSIGTPVQLTVVWIGMGSLILALLEKRRLIIQVPQNLKQLEALRNDQNKTTEDSP